MRDKKSEQRGLFTAVCVVGALCAAAFILLLVCIKVTSAPRFEPPAFEAAAQEGIPTVPEELGWSELWQEGMEFKVGICGVVHVTNGTAEVYFTNVEGDAWLKLRVLDEQGNILGETGLVRENMYVRTMQLSVPVHDKQPVSMKVMAYEPETYQSLGAVALNTTLAVEK